MIKLEITQWGEDDYEVLQSENGRTTNFMPKLTKADVNEVCFNEFEEIPADAEFTSLSGEIESLIDSMDDTRSLAGSARYGALKECLKIVRGNS